MLHSPRLRRRALAECAALVPILLAAEAAPAQHVYDPAIKAEVIRLIETKYFRPVQIDTSLPADSIVWLLDPHSEYLSAQQANKRFAALNHTDFTGFGFWLMRIGRHVIVDAVADHDCAARAGLLAGDEVLSIGGHPVDSMTDRDLSAFMSDGGEWAFELLVYRKSMDSSLRIWISRNAKTPFICTSFGMIDDTTGFTRIHEFSRCVSLELHWALDSLRERGMTSLILDLRGNPGGLVGELINCERLFVGGNLTLLTTRSQVEADNITYNAEGLAPYATLPLTVLVDHESWSAAELLAGSLQDLDRALIVGEATGGKALVMRYLPLSNGDKVLLTTAGAVLPSGRCTQSLYYDAHYIMDAPDLPSGDNSAHEYDEYYTQMPCRTYSTAHGRNVSWHEGIIPDIIVPHPTEYIPDPYLAILDTFVVLRLRDSANYYLAQGLRAFMTTSHFGAKFCRGVQTRIEQADESPNLHVSTLYASRLEKNLEWRVAKRLWGFDGYLRYYSVRSPMVRRALIEPRRRLLTGAH